MKTVLVTGSSGLLGSALVSIRHLFPYHFVFCTRASADLTKEAIVNQLYEKIRPDYVIHAAAKVGGIGGNSKHHGEYFYENSLMNAHMIHYAYKYHVSKFLAFSSVCAFPYDVPVLREDLIQSGEPFPGNFAYGYAKRMVDVQISAYRAQYGIENFCSIIPGNIFGEHDLYNIESGHVVPSLIHKIYLAKRDNTPLKVWGDGSAKREFIYSKDLANLAMKILAFNKIPQRIIISGERQYTIRELVSMLCEVAEFDGNVEWEMDKPNGVKDRATDLTLLKSLVGDLRLTHMNLSLKNSYKWFENNWPDVRN